MALAPDGREIREVDQATLNRMAYARTNVQPYASQGLIRTGISGMGGGGRDQAESGYIYYKLKEEPKPEPAPAPAPAPRRPSVRPAPRPAAPPANLTPETRNDISAPASGHEDTVLTDRTLPADNERPGGREEYYAPSLVPNKGKKKKSLVSI